MPAAFRVAIAQFFATPLLGRSDVFRRKPLLVISLFGTVVANLLASFTPVASLLFVARVFDGLTRGNTSIVSYSTPFWFRVFSHWRRLLLRCGSSRSLIVAVNLSDAASICDR